MPKDIFRFKQFEICHMRSSMRVSTDAVLLGAWTRIGKCAEDSGTRILDIGCGCGLIALMVAQRSLSGYVLGIDIDAASVCEAKQNAIASPFANRVIFREADVRNFAREEGRGSAFSLIVCNPPYYTEDTLPPESRRSVARNAHHLVFSELLASVGLLLDKDGIFSVVVPMHVRDVFVSEAMVHQLCLCRECRVQTVMGKSPKRVLMEFSKGQCGPVVMETIVLQDINGNRTAEYANLCVDFYL